MADPLTLILSALSTAATVGNAISGGPDPSNQPAPSPGGTEANLNAFQLPVPTTSTVTPPPALDMAQMEAQLEALAQQLAAHAAAPSTVPLQSPGDLRGPPASTEEPTESAGPTIGQILQAAPEAISAAATLLGLGNQPRPSDRPAPIPGGAAANALIPGLSLPPTMNVGALLAAIPRIS